MATSFYLNSPRHLQRNRRFAARMDKLFAGESAVDTAANAAYKAYKEVEARKQKNNRLGLIKAPESWAEAERTHVNGHTVSSALEVAGDDMRFPPTGATVRAVPARHESAGSNNKLIVVSGPPTAISRPGDTFWKGASGRKPQRIGDPPKASDDTMEDENPPAALVAPNDIILCCTDGDDKHETEVRVTWDMSWSDVLDQLKAKNSQKYSTQGFYTENT